MVKIFLSTVFFAAALTSAPCSDAEQFLEKMREHVPMWEKIPGERNKLMYIKLTMQNLAVMIEKNRAPMCDALMKTIKNHLPKELSALKASVNSHQAVTTWDARSGD